MNSSHTLIVLLAVSIPVATVVARSGLTEQAAAGAAREATQGSGRSRPAEFHPENGKRVPANKREGVNEAGKER